MTEGKQFYRRKPVIAAALGGCVLLGGGIALGTGFGSSGGPSDAAATSSPAAPVAPLSDAGYQAGLTAFDKKMADGLAQVHKVKSSSDLTTALGNLKAAITEGQASLDGIMPPTPVAAAHGDLLEALRSVDRQLPYSGAGAKDLTHEDTCGGVQASAEDVDVLVGRAFSREKGKPVAALAAKKFTVGTFVPKLPAGIGSRRAGNGEVLQRSGPRGPRTLKINNGSDRDTVVSVVDGDPAKPKVMVYVRSKSNATATGIAGSYDVYFKTGTDWLAARRQFTKDCVFSKYDDRFDGASDWEIELRPSAEGNATTSDVEGY